MERNFDELKKGKFFKKFDLIIYFVLLVVILCLLFVFVIKKESPSLKGIKIERDNQIIYSYYFSGKEKIESGVIKTEAKDGFYLKIVGSSEEENILFVNVKDRKVTMKKANCSLNADCTYMKITKGGEKIVCIPHGIIVHGLGSENLGDITVG